MGQISLELKGDNNVENGGIRMDKILFKDMIHIHKLNI